MAFQHPTTGETLPVFADAPESQTMFRVVCKANLTAALALDLLDAVRESLDFLDRAGTGYAKIHRKKRDHLHRTHGRHAC